MRYRFLGEDYQTMKELLWGPIRRAHPNATSCFIDAGRFVVVMSDGNEHHYRLDKASDSLTIIY